MSNWVRREDEDRQRDHSRANHRAKRLRKTLTPSEKKLRALLKTINQQGAHFRSQVALGDFVFDFGDFKRRILIEVDGGVHRLPDVQLRDSVKTEWAKSQGFELLRFDANMPFAGADQITRAIVEACNRSPHPLIPAPPGGGETR